MKRIDKMKKIVYGHTAGECFVLTQKYGSMSVGRGVYMETASSIIGRGTHKHIDFSTAPYWLFTPDSQVPIGIRTESELEKYANFEGR